MDKELYDLFKSGTFKFVSWDKVLKQSKEIVLTTWAFCKKRHPSGEAYHFKARTCMCRDLQRDNYLNNEMFAPIVEWATIRMFFLLSIIKGWSTASIDFKNTFAQATLPKPIYLELPPGYVQPNPGAKDKVMKIKKSLHGDCCAANLWCSMLRMSLIYDMGSCAWKWIHVYLSRATVSWHCMWMMQLSSPKIMQKLNMCCNSSLFAWQDVFIISGNQAPEYVWWAHQIVTATPQPIHPCPNPCTGMDGVWQSSGCHPNQFFCPRPPARSALGV